MINVMQFASDVIQDVKTAITAGIVMTGTTSTTWIDWIPDDIAKIGALVGLPITIGLFFFQYRKWRRDEERHNDWKNRRRSDSTTITPE